MLANLQETVNLVTFTKEHQLPNFTYLCSDEAKGCFNIGEQTMCE